MNIYEAMKARTGDKPFLVRRKWVNELGTLSLYGARILPTGAPDGCLLQSRVCGERRPPAPRWQPLADDLLADDWEISD